MDAYRLRGVVDTLHSEGELVYHDDPIDLIDVARTLEDSQPAVCFRSVNGCELPLVGNVMATRRRLALAMGVAERDLLATVRDRAANPIPATEVASAQAPVHDVVWEGDEVDLTRLPIHLQHEMDGAPYISASMDYVTDGQTGFTNVGCRRIMPLGRAIASVDMNAPSDFRAMFLRRLEKGEPLPVAFAIGSHPADLIGCQIMLPASDELALLGGIRGASIPVVKCRTIDQVVPADAELVLEGYLDAAGYVEAEGPYGEYLGYYGKVKRNPLFRITAITMRRDALFETITIGGRNLARTDTSQLTALRTEAAVWSALEVAIREPLDVFVPPSSGGMFNARFSLRQRYPGEARNGMAAVLSSSADVKHVYAVDGDVDIFSDGQIEWAIATRFQADRDLLAMSNMRAFPLDPSLEEARVGAKAGFDLTLPFGRSQEPEFQVPEVPRFDGAGQGGGSVEGLLGEGPQTFYDLMKGLGTRDGREVLREFDRLRAEGRLKRIEDGRYVIAEAS